MKPIIFAIVRFVIAIAFIVVSLPMNSAADAQVTLQWDANVPAPQGYRLYWRTQDQPYNYYQYFDTGLSTTQTVYGLAEYTTYLFVVRAYVGNEQSGDSNEVAFNSDGSTMVHDTNPPSQPYTVNSNDDAQDVPLQPALQSSSFYDPDADDFHIQSRWQIYRLDDDSLVLDLTSGASLTQLTVPSSVLEPFTAYYWTVSHINQIGAESPQAPPAYFTTGSETGGNPSSNLGGSNFGGGSGSGGGCLIQTLRNR